MTKYNTAKQFPLLRLVLMVGLTSCGVSRVKKSQVDCGTHSENNDGKGAVKPKNASQQTALTTDESIKLALAESFSLDSATTNQKLENNSFVGGIVSAKIYSNDDWAEKNWPNFSFTDEEQHCSALFRLSKQDSGYSIVAHTTDECADNIFVRGKDIKVHIFGKADSGATYGYETFNASSENATLAENFFKGAVDTHIDLKSQYKNMLFTDPLVHLEMRFSQFFTAKEKYSEEEKLKIAKENCISFADKTKPDSQDEKAPLCVYAFSTRFYKAFISKKEASGRDKFLDDAAAKSQAALAKVRERFSKLENFETVQAALNFEDSFLKWEKALSEGLQTKFLETIANTNCAELKETDYAGIGICASGKKKAVEIGIPFFQNPEIASGATLLVNKNFDETGKAKIAELRLKYRDLRRTASDEYLSAISKTKFLVAKNIEKLAFGTNFVSKENPEKPKLYFDLKKIPLTAGSFLGTLYYTMKDGLLTEVPGNSPSSSFRTEFTSGKVLFLDGFPLWGTQTDVKQNGGASLTPLPARNGGESKSQLPSGDLNCK